MIVITGHRTTIAQQFRALVSANQSPPGFIFGTASNIPLDGTHYLFAAGVLHGTMIEPETALETLQVNFAEVARTIEAIIATNDRARICVIGSDSGLTGSYDMAYAGSKAALQLFVETKRLRTPDQQLVAIAPGIIGDAGMTLRRTDKSALDRRRQALPKRLFVRSADVARLAYFLLFEDTGQITGTTVRINGGEHTTR